MTPIEQAILYADRFWPIFPCIPSGPRRKTPLTKHGFLDASIDEATIRGWWHRWPNALIGMATGLVSEIAVLDVDVKDPAAYGFDTLDELGFAILPQTPMAHTASGGLHLHFDAGGRYIPSTQGAIGRGIGPGLDWRAEGGFVILPSPGSGYFWDPYWNYATVAPAPIPAELLPREPKPVAAVRPVEREEGLSPYARAALDRACQAIIAAANGVQEKTLGRECFSIGTLAGAGAIPEGFARRALTWAARQVTSYDARRPWTAAELDRKVERAFETGLDHPRQVRHG